MIHFLQIRRIDAPEHRRHSVRIARIIAWLRPERIKSGLRAIIATEAPVGYQDATGYHDGVRHKSPR
jgi:hypothetical protein